MSMYVFAPAGPQDFHNNLLRIAIEFIGLHEKGCSVFEGADKILDYYRAPKGAFRL